MKQVCLALFMGLFSSNIIAAEYSPPTLKKSAIPKYPIDRFSEANEESVDEGLVEVLFMVNKEGQTYAPRVLRASMDRFIEPALRALAKFEYEPARVDGQPVDARQKSTLEFKIAAADLRSARGSTSGFTSVRDRGVPDGYQSHYDEFTDEIAKADPDQVHLQSLLNLMVGLKHQSFYSLAYHSLARFRFAEKFQGNQEKIAALKDLVWFDPYIKPKYQILQDDLESAIWTNLLKLQIEGGQYAEALQTNAWLQQENSELAAPFADYISQIDGLKASTQFTQRAFAVDDSGRYVVPLLKRSFLFNELSGGLDKLELYCDATKATLEFAPDAQYEVPASWGECVLVIDAADGSRGKLLEQ